MSEYSHLTIINGTPYDFIRGPHHSFQMDDWDSAFPEKISSGDSARIQVSFQNPLFHSKHNDAAEQSYWFSGGNGSFEIQGRSPDDGYHLLLDASKMVSPSHPDDHNNPIDLGWKEDSELYIWISGSNGGFLIRKWWQGDEA
jgi:hypothetical protein